MHVHCARTRGGSDLRQRAARAGRRQPRLPPARAADRRARAGSTAEQLDGLCPDWRERETFLCGPARLAADAERALARRGRSGEAARRALPARRAGRRWRARRGRHDPLLHERRRGERATASSRSSSPASRPARSCRTAVAWASATRCVGRLRSGQVRDLRTGQRARTAGRDDAHLHQRARGRGRDRALKHRRTPKEATMSANEIQQPTASPTATATDARDPVRGRPRTPSRASPPSRSSSSAASSTRSTTRSTPSSATATRATSARTIKLHRQLVLAARAMLLRLALHGRCGSAAPPRCRWRRSSRTWRSATT